VTSLVTDWLPSPTWTPGLMLAPAFTSELAMPTFASTPTFGFTSVLVLLVLVDGDEADEPEAPAVSEPDEPDVPERFDDVSDVLDCVVLAPWFIEDVEPMSVEDWFAETLLSTVWLPLPMLTPGLTLAPRFTSVLLTPTFASTPTFGFTLSEDELLVDEGEDVLPVPEAPPELLALPEEMELELSELVVPPTIAPPLAALLP
jgi:hypothetical protein